MLVSGWLKIIFNSKQLLDESLLKSRRAVVLSLCGNLEYSLEYALMYKL